MMLSIGLISVNTAVIGWAVFICYFIFEFRRSFVTPLHFKEKNVRLQLCTARRRLTDERFYCIQKRSVSNVSHEIMSTLKVGRPSFVKTDSWCKPATQVARKFGFGHPTSCATKITQVYRRSFTLCNLRGYNAPTLLLQYSVLWGLENRKLGIRRA